MRINYIQNGDAITLLKDLPSESIDAVITDPPYSSGGFTRSDKNKDPISKYNNTSKYISYSGDNRDQRSYVAWMKLWNDEVMRILKPSGYCLVFTDWRMLPTITDVLQISGLIWRGVISWDKGLSARAPHKGYFRHQCEYVAWGTKGSADKQENSNGPWPGSYQIPVKLSDKHHLTGKPTDLMRKLVKCCPPGGVVLDPFCGSGTTCVATKMEGRNYIGFELSKEYADIAVKRIEKIGKKSGE